MFKYTIALVGLSVLTFSANAALYDRGNKLIYDDVLNITWLQDSNYAGGAITWDQAQTWVDNLSYGGYDDWRLPSANLINGASPCIDNSGSCDSGYNIKRSELGHMFHTNLANLGMFDVNGVYQPGHGVTNSSFADGGNGSNVSILNLENWVYWFDEQYAPDTGRAWSFFTAMGWQVNNAKTDTSISWAVRDGDVTFVPVPAAMWLLSTALLGLAGVKRRYR